MDLLVPDGWRFSGVPLLSHAFEVLHRFLSHLIRVQISRSCNRFNISIEFTAENNIVRPSVGGIPYRGLAPRRML
jgi:hypothetical protein